MRRISLRTESLAMATAVVHAIYEMHGDAVKSVSIRQQAADRWPVSIALHGDRAKEAWGDILRWATSYRQPTRRSEPPEHTS